MLHRDLNFSNILVVREHPKTTIDIKEKLRDSKTKAVITDFANTHKIENVARRAIPSAGGHLVTDPFIYKELTGMPGRYSVASEMYSIGANMFYALTGKSIFDCEVFGGRKRAMVMIGGKETSMLDSKGHIDAAKFRKAVEENVGKLDRKYQNIIRKCFLSPLGEGYSDIEQLKKEFDKLKPNPAMRWLKMTGLVAGAAALIAAGAITVAYNLNSQKEQLNQEKEQLYQEMDLQTEVYESGREFDKDMQKLDKIISDAEIFRLSLEKMQANPKTRIIPDEAWEKLQKKQKEREEKKQEELKNLEKLNP
jgi:serine/threonine protein kinase